MVDGCVRLSPGEVERYQRETARRLRCERLRHVRQHEDALAQASRSCYLERRHSDEKQRHASEVRGLLQQKREQLLGLLEEQDASNKARGAARRQAIEHTRLKSLEAAQKKQLEAARQEVEVRRCQEALRWQRQPQLQHDREVREQLERQWQVREQEIHRAQEAAVRGREAAMAQEAAAKALEMEAREVAKALPRRVHCTDGHGSVDYSKTYYHITHHGHDGPDPTIEADFARPLSPPPAPTPSQLQKAQVRGLAAQAKLASQKSIAAAEDLLAAEEAKCRAEKVQRVLAAAAPRSGSPPRVAWGVLRGPAEASAEAEMAKLLADPEPDETSLPSTEMTGQDESECALRVPRRGPMRRATSASTGAIPEEHGETAPPMLRRVPKRRAASNPGTGSSAAEKTLLPLSDVRRAASSARLSQARKSQPALARKIQGPTGERRPHTAALASRPRPVRRAAAQSVAHRVPTAGMEEVLLSENSCDDSVLASLPSPQSASPEALGSDSLTLSRTPLDDTVSESVLNESAFYDDRPLNAQIFELSPHPEPAIRAGGESTAPLPSPPRGGPFCNLSVDRAPIAEVGGQVAMPNPEGDAVAMETVNSTAENAASSPPASRMCESRAATALADSPGTPLGDSPLPGAERLAGLLTEAEALLRETASTAAMADAAATLPLSSASPHGTGRQPSSRDSPHDGWVADGRLWRGGDLGLQLEEICRELDQVVGPGLACA